MLNYKSILFKGKYYPISYKLNFILSSNLFVLRREKNTITYNKDIKMHNIGVSIKCKQIVCYNKFILTNLKIRTDNYKLYIYYLKLHRINKPAIILYDGKNISMEYYYQHGELHRLNGPAIIKYKKGEIKKEIFYICNMLLNTITY